VPNKDELLFVAMTQAKAMFDSGYRPPTKAVFAVAGRSALATIKGQLANMRDGGFISAHDFHVSTLIAEVVCGGDVDAGSMVTEEYLMTWNATASAACWTTPRPGTHHGHAADRQARSELSGDESHEQTSARRLHRRRHPHPHRPQRPGLLPQHAA
jgi:hypothetical protein